MARARLEDVLTRHQVFVQRLSAGQVGKFEPFLRQIIAALRERLDDEELTTFTRQRLDKLLAAVEKSVAKGLDSFTSSLLSDLQDFAQHEAEFSARAIADSAAGFEPVVPSASQIRSAVLTSPLAARGVNGGKLLQNFIGDWTRAEKTAVSGAIRLGVFEGQTNAQIVRQLVGTRSLNFADGLVAISRRNAAAIVHTAVQHVSTQARRDVFEENEEVISKVRWISTLDNRTCERCAALDRKAFDLKKGPRPPLHVRCRCTTIAVLKSEWAKLAEGGTRASAGATGGKQVPASLTYFDWLTDQPAGFQDAALGPARAKLLRDGGLTATRFAQLQLDRNFMPMTLADMRRLEPLAFERAGL